MPKYRITFTHSEEDSVDVEACSQEEAIKIFPSKLSGFEDVEFVEIECLDIDEEGNERCDKTAELF